MSRAALQALDAWREIGEQNTSRAGRLYLHGFNQSAVDKGDTIHMPDGDQFVDTLMRVLALGEIYSAQPDTVDLVSAAAETIPYHPVLAGDELPSPFGFLYLAKPIGTRDVHGKMIRVHAIQWWPSLMQIERERGTPAATAAAVNYVLYSRSTDMVDDYSTMADPQTKHFLPWPLSLVHTWPADQHAFTVTADGTPVDTKIPLADGDEWDGAFFHRWVLSWWLIVKQQMVAVAEEVPPKEARRRLQRAVDDRDVRIPMVNVVDLRRRAHTDTIHTTGGVEFSHRWGVRPHWRRQWYPSLQEHKLRLIGFQIRGPEDKPLVLKKTVFDVRPPRPGST